MGLTKALLNNVRGLQTQTQTIGTHKAHRHF